MYNARIRSDTHLYIPREPFVRYFILTKSNAIDKMKTENFYTANIANRARIATSHANTSRMRGYKIFIIIIKQIKKV